MKERTEVKSQNSFQHWQYICKIQIKSDDEIWTMKRAKTWSKIVDLFEGRSDCNVLDAMVVTFPTFHEERSPLNTLALLNTRKWKRETEVKSQNSFQHWQYICKVQIKSDDEIWTMKKSKNMVKNSRSFWREIRL